MVALTPLGRKPYIKNDWTAMVVSADDGPSCTIRTLQDIRQALELYWMASEMG